MRSARGAGGGRRALQQDMEQFTAISTLRGIMFLSRGNVYHGSSEFARFHHFEKMLFGCVMGGRWADECRYGISVLLRVKLVDKFVVIIY